MGSRRLAGLALLALLGILSAPGAGAAPNPIAAENALPGDRGWAITQAAGTMLEAYASAASVQRGERVDVHVRADAPHTILWKLYRMGWYGGAGARLMATGGPVAVGPQPVPAPDPSTGLVECRWPVSFTIETAPDWTSGIYLVKLARDDGPQTYAIFVVRADERRGVAVVQASFATYQAYNAYGGRSLYVGPAQEVSYDRPFVEGSGSGQFFRYEQAFVEWAEARGFDLGYVTNLDLDRDPTLLRGQRLFVSVGHDEYWTRTARDAVEAALGAGVNAAFLGGNDMFWQIRLEPSRGDPGRPRRTQVCYKAQVARDPLQGTALATTQFRDPALGDPENATLGVMFTAWLLADAPWVVVNAKHWLYEGTGVRDGDTIPGIVGYETDRMVGNGRAPSRVEKVARSPVFTVDGDPDWHEASVSVRDSGAFLFAAGTIEWSWGLALRGVADARVQRMTENVFRRAGLAPTTAAGLLAPGPPGADTRGAAGGVVTIAGAAFQEGLVDGPAAAARFRRPSGAAVTASGELVVADTGNHAIRLVRADAARTVETILGDGTPGAGEGPGARLRAPQAVAIAPDGTVVVADTGNARLLRLRPSGAGWTSEALAGAAGIPGAADGPGPLARFAAPAGLAFVGGDLYVADRQNHAVRRVAPDGTVTTIAGANDGVWYRDGVGADARFHFPSDLAAADGGLLVVDAGNRLVRRLALPSLEVTTVAGMPGGGFADGPAGGARFMPLAGIASAAGDVLVADAGNARLRKVSAGAVTTWAGDGEVGGLDGAGAEARLGGPIGLAPLGSGKWLVVDGGSSTLRVAGAVTVPPPPPQRRAQSHGGGCSTAGEFGSALLGLLGLGVLRGRSRRAAAVVRG